MCGDDKEKRKDICFYLSGRSSISSPSSGRGTFTGTRSSSFIKGISMRASSTRENFVNSDLLKNKVIPKVKAKRITPIASTSVFATPKKSLECGSRPIPTSCDETGQNAADEGL
jgi:hypothetical protein